MLPPKIRVLLAEDNHQILEYVRKFVSGYNCRRGSRQGSRNKLGQILSVGSSSPLDAGLRAL